MLKDKFQIAAARLLPVLPDIDDHIWNMYANTLPFIAKGSSAPMMIPFHFEKDGEIIASAEFKALPSAYNLAQIALWLVLETQKDFEWDHVSINHINRFSRAEIMALEPTMARTINEARQTQSIEQALSEFIGKAAALSNQKHVPCARLREQYETLKFNLSATISNHVRDVNWTQKPPPRSWAAQLLQKLNLS
jgi:hypothetical protein